MAHLINRTKGACQVVIGCIAIATMAVTVPLSASASYPATQERSIQESSIEKQQVAPDNSKNNRRDRDDKNLTPMDQGTSAQDIKITKDIRKEIHKRKGISSNGKNVKIITIDGLVTLRGPVASADEKQLIKEIARKIAGPSKVDNQLEVK